MVMLAVVSGRQANKIDLPLNRQKWLERSKEMLPAKERYALAQCTGTRVEESCVVDKCRT